MEKVHRLDEAFSRFTRASKSLESCYEALSSKVQYLTQELEIKNRQMKELERHKERNERLISMGEMAAKIVHEVRSPLCSIELFSNMLTDDLEGTRHAHMARGISTAIKNLNTILTNMLFFAKPQRPSLSPVQLRDVINQSLEVLVPLIEVRNIRVSTALPSMIINGDNELLQQVFMNILLNAVQAMPDGGALTAGIASVDGYVTVSVIDEGEGIPDEYLEKIFDPFFSTKDKGTGLGLAISHKIMQSHNGFIKAFRNSGKGSTFCLYFPASDQQAAAEQDGRSHERAKERNAGGHEINSRRR